MATQEPRRRVPINRVTGALATLAVAISGCSWFNGPVGPPAPPTTASVSLNWIWPAGGQGIRCTGTTTWALDPISFTGSTGDVSKQPWTTDNDVMSSGVGNQQICRFSTSQSNLRAGTWRFSVGPGPYAGSCEVTLRAGVNAATWDASKGTCG